MFSPASIPRGPGAQRVASFPFFPLSTIADKCIVSHLRTTTRDVVKPVVFYLYGRAHHPTSHSFHPSPSPSHHTNPHQTIITGPTRPLTAPPAIYPFTYPHQSSIPRQHVPMPAPTPAPPHPATPDPSAFPAQPPSTTHFNENVQLN